MKYKIFFLNILSLMYCISVHSHSTILGKKTAFTISITEQNVESFLIPAFLRENKNFLTDSKFKVYAISIMNKSEDFFLYNSTKSTLLFIEDKKCLLPSQRLYLQYKLLLGSSIACGVGFLGLTQTMYFFGLMQTLQGSLRKNRFKNLIFQLSNCTFSFGLVFSLLIIPLNILKLKADWNSFVDNDLFSSSLHIKPHELCKKISYY